MYPSLMSAFCNITTSGPQEPGPNGVLVGNNCSVSLELFAEAELTIGTAAVAFVVGTGTAALSFADASLCKR